MASPALDKTPAVTSAKPSSFYLNSASGSADGPDILSVNSSANSTDKAFQKVSLLSFPSLTTDRTERVVASLLESLLQRFSVQQLDVISEQELSALLTCCRDNHSADISLSELQDSSLIAELKRRIMRLSGAQLGKAFVSMSPDIVDEAEVEHLFLEVEGRQLQGVRYQGEVYRLMDAFAPSYRLQAYCLGQTLNEQTISYLITRSTERFAVWVNAKALPQRSLSI